jgi:hypothetical protein
MAPQAAAATPAPGAAPTGGATDAKDAKAGPDAGPGPAAAGPLHESVQAALDAARAGQAQHQAAAAQSAAEYKQTIEVEKNDASSEIARFQAARDEAAAKRKRRADDDVAAGPKEGAEETATDAETTDEEGGDAPVGTSEAEEFEMDGETHTLTVTRTADGVSITMASEPGQLRAKAQTALSSARLQLEQVKAELAKRKGDRSLGEQKVKLDDLTRRLERLVQKVDEEEASGMYAALSPAELHAKAVDLAGVLVKIGRTHQLKDLGSLEALEIEGHQHDRFIYETLVELAQEIRAERAAPVVAPSAKEGEDPVQATFERELALARGEYLRARTSPANTFHFHGPELFVDQRDGYVFPDEDVGPNRGVLDGKVYAWSAAEGRLDADALADSQPWRQQLHKTYKYPRSWTVAEMLTICQRVGSGEGLDKLQSTLFVAAMVAEADRNLVSEVTNFLVLGGDPNDAVFSQMPMTFGGTAPRDKNVTDPTLEGASPQLPPGTVTDQEIELAKRYFEEKTKEPLSDAVERIGRGPEARAHIKEILRTLFVQLGTSSS